MKYSQILKEMVDYQEPSAIDYTVEDGYDETVDEFALGTSVRIHVDSFDSLVDGIEEQDRESVKQKLIAGEVAIIFNEDGDSADVVFKDGAEIYNVPFSVMSNIEAEEGEFADDAIKGPFKITDFF